MSKRDTVILAHRGEYDGARAYEEVNSPFEAQRLVFLPLCAEKLAPDRIVPQLRLSVAGAESAVLAVPVIKEKLVPQCEPGWAGEHPCARCVMERWGEVLGGDPSWHGGLRLKRLHLDEDVEGNDAELLGFVKDNRPGFSFEISSPLAVPAARFKFSRRPAALFLGNTLFVQSRRRAPRPGDIETLLGVKVPQVPSDLEPDVGVPLTLEDNALYTPEQVARYLGIVLGTLYNWVSSGKIPHTKVGGKTRFLGKVLREWLESQTNWPMNNGEPEAPIHKFPWKERTR